MTKRERTIVTRILVVLSGLIIMQCMGIPGVDLIFRISFGWIPFLANAVDRVRMRWEMLFSAVVYLAAALIGAQLFLRWLYRELNPAGRWKGRWTISGLAVFIMMFTSGIAVTGVAHQTAWLITSPEPLYKKNSRSRETAYRIKCASNLRQIGAALAEYTKANGGKYPDDFGALLLNADVTAEIFVCAASNDEKANGKDEQEVAANLLTPGHCSYIYLGKGLSAPVDARKIMAHEPLADHEEGLHVLYGDGSVVYLDKAQAEKMAPALAPATQ